MVLISTLLKNQENALDTDWWTTGVYKFYTTKVQRPQIWRYIDFYLPLVADPATTTRLPLRVRALVWVR